MRRKEQRWMLALAIVVAFAAVRVLAAGPVGADPRGCAGLRLAADKVGCPPAPVEKTGQQASHATGDDGELQMGVAWPDPRFTDNEDGTVTDNLTGLIWLKNANCAADPEKGDPGTMNWADALAYCNNLADGSCGLTDGSVSGDWRLPNIKELQSLIDYGNYNPAVPSGHPFSDLQPNLYWSATTYVNVPDQGAWYVKLGYGSVDYGFKSKKYYVWPVRGGQ